MYIIELIFADMHHSGLVVNGVVAFMLPLVLALFLFQRRKESVEKLKQHEDSELGPKYTLVERTLSGRILALLAARRILQDDEKAAVQPQQLPSPSPPAETKASFLSCLCGAGKPQVDFRAKSPQKSLKTPPVIPSSFPTSG